jgi:hypothetical protein
MSANGDGIITLRNYSQVGGAVNLFKNQLDEMRYCMTNARRHIN